MANVVVAVDGSQNALEAVRYAAGLAAADAAIRLHLLNVQPPLPAAAATFIDRDVLRSFHQEEGQKALAEARALLDGGTRAYECHVAVGDAAEAITAYAQDRAADRIVMGTRGLGTLAGLLLGSVAIRVVQLAQIPVTLTPLRRS
jgi:nucleotide-binding universal stress UspA family protein